MAKRQKMEACERKKSESAERSTGRMVYSFAPLQSRALLLSAIKSWASFVDEVYAPELVTHWQDLFLLNTSRVRKIQEGQERSELGPDSTIKPFIPVMKVLGRGNAIGLDAWAKNQQFVIQGKLMQLASQLG